MTEDEKLTDFYRFQLERDQACARWQEAVKKEDELEMVRRGYEGGSFGGHVVGGEVDLLQDEYIRLRKETDQRCAPIIRLNLAKFGLDDVEVFGGLFFPNGQEKIVQTPYFLSDLSAMGSRALAQLIGENPFMVAEGMSFFQKNNNGEYEKSGKIVTGVKYVDYHKAPDLRTMVGWLVATSIGRVEALENFNLDELISKIKKVVRDYYDQPDLPKDPFHKENTKLYPQLLQRIVSSAHEKIDEILPQRMGSINVWNLAKKELGIE